MKYFNQYKGIIIKKKFGQHFIDNYLIRKKILYLINPKYEDILIEIGPGLASLTCLFVKLVKKLFIIELDEQLSEKLCNTYFSKKLIIFQKNVLDINFNIFFNNNVLIRVFGNIPYNISTKLFMYLFKFSNIIFDMNFMVQKEVAYRLLASPGSKLYGRLSIISQYYFKISKLFFLPSVYFYPKPKVDSIFLNFTPYKKKKYYLKNSIDVLSYITFLAFCKRRKILKNSLSSIISEKKLIKLNINPFLRAENVTIQQYCNIANYLL